MTRATIDGAGLNWPSTAVIRVRLTPRRAQMRLC